MLLLLHSKGAESRFGARPAQSAVTRLATDARRILQTAQQRWRGTQAISETITLLQLKEYLERQSDVGCMSIPISSS